ncbi:hypothetical protein DASC09_052750 [Saccharomycopsis crataegensis]|uniref:26S proteasome complex subunit SEM1 n=1 Tax=Saccharomycopsis crataegensis TaxID=43959 RepID=A0AAV5QTM6_9ASCO|nr:hypothetical protein DASC09_052750 [Saccharomycopsis crataegensis]
MSKEDQIPAAPVATPAAAASKPEKEVQTLEEDDEFEDFQEETWLDEHDVGKQDQGKLWDEDWDDEDVEDDFAQQLKSELAKVQTK